ncbi:MAG: glycosyltransferase family 9 protein [Candidatus Omnitrophica bacterium]|nr:glycosyltransferase family 9 protein [Candidatus Omnitrophota bacterium]
MYILYAPPSKFGIIPPKTPLISDEVLFTNNIAYCPKFFWQKYHVLQGCLDLTPNWMVRRRQTRDLRSILVLAGGGIGDSLWIMPFVKALHKRHPQANIMVMTNERAMPIWQHVPYCSACVKDEFWNMQSLIRRCEEVYDFSGIATYMKKAARMDPVDATFHYGGLPRPKSSSDCRAMLVVTLDEGKRAEALLARHGVDTTKDKIITIALETSTPNRNWPLSYTATLSTSLTQAGYKVIWLGESHDRAQASLERSFTPTLAQNLVVPTPSNVVNLCGQTSLRDCIAILALSDVVVGSSSGLLCIATALEIPSVGLWGAYSPKCRDKYYIKWYPIWRPLPCSPCNQHWTECPHGHPAPCMKNIQPELVFTAVLHMLAKYPRSIIGKRPID